MIKGVARSRINRALDARARAPGEVLELSVGDLVDFYRPPASKDVPGWRGPASVTDVSSISHGTVSLRWQSHAIECRIRDIRHALMYQ
eukprot:2595782-Lingulodinium_polyedra.AAC.1